MPSKKVTPSAAKGGLLQKILSIHPWLWAVWAAIIGLCVAGWWFRDSGTEAVPLEKSPAAAAKPKPAFSSFVEAPSSEPGAGKPAPFGLPQSPGGAAPTPAIPGQPAFPKLPSPEELAKIQPPPEVAAGLAHPPPEIMEGLKHPPPELMEGLKHPPPWVTQPAPPAGQQPPAAPPAPVPQGK